MDIRSCQHCDATFTPIRSTARFCSDSCRKAGHQKTERQAHPVNAKNSPSERRVQMELFERNMRLAEMYYTHPPADRPRFLLELIREAIEGNSKVKRVLTNRVFLRPDRSDKHKFWRGTSNYPTLAQEAHRLSKEVVGVGIDAVISGGWDLFGRLVAAEDHVLEAALTDAICPTSTAIEQDPLKQGRQLGPLTRLAYSVALAAARVSVVRTERRDAA